MRSPSDHTCGSCAFWRKSHVTPRLLSRPNGHCQTHGFDTAMTDTCSERSFIDLHIEGETMEHARGQWAGTRPKWWTFTDRATGFSIRLHDECGRRSQSEMRSAAVSTLELLIDLLQPEFRP